MVETITPVVHGGRRSRWALLLAVHTAGASIAAAGFGALLGGAGALLGAPWGGAGLAVVAAAAAVYLAREAFGLPIPIPQLRRQVPDWWRSFFPFAPAAFLYGVGLGVGFFTYLARGTLVVVAAAAVSSGSPWTGMLLLAPFGLVRGLSAVVAARAVTPDDGSELVGRLARSASWAGWRVAHVLVLFSVLVAAVVAASELDAQLQVGALAAAVLAVAFAAAGISKLVRHRTWRRALRSYAFPASVERVGAMGVPIAELGVTMLVALGLRSTAGLASLCLLVAFSVVTARVRLRGGRQLDCGCFGGSVRRDYRTLLARNAVLAIVATVAWRLGDDVTVARLPSAPRGSELVAVALVAVGVTLAVWVGASALRVIRRGGGA